MAPPLLRKICRYFYGQRTPFASMLTLNEKESAKGGFPGKNGESTILLE